MNHKQLDFLESSIENCNRYIRWYLTNKNELGIKPTKQEKNDYQYYGIKREVLIKLKEVFEKLK